MKKKKKSAAKPVKSKATSRKTREKKTAFHLKLYIAGQTGKSEVALRNLKELCETHLKGKYDLEVIDLLQQPQLAKGDQIFAIPTLIKKVPKPVRKIIGDLSDADKVLVGLNIKPVGRA